MVTVMVRYLCQHCSFSVGLHAYIVPNRSGRRGYKQRFDGNKIFIGNGCMEMVHISPILSSPSSLSGTGVTMLRPLHCTPSGAAISNAGLSPLLFLQNAPSVLVSRALDVKPGQLVLDMV